MSIFLRMLDVISLSSFSFTYCVLANEWKTQIEVLNLSHLKLKKIRSLEGMVNLQQANFSHNLIEKIENLECCPNIG